MVVCSDGKEHFLLCGKTRKGSKHKVTLIREHLFDGKAQQLRDKAVQLALTGDTVALKLCLERIVPALPTHRSTVPPVHIPKLATAVGFQAKADAVLGAVADGLLAPDVGTALIDAIARLRHADQPGAVLSGALVIRDETGDADGRGA
jgi:hypothetical protein